MPKNKKHYHENYVPTTNTFKVPKGSIEIRGRYTEAQINYIKFKWFWIGQVCGGALIASIFYLQENNII